MVNAVAVVGNLLPKISDPKNAIETSPASWVERAQRRFLVCQITETARKCSSIWSVIVQKFARAFILTHTNMAVVRSDRNHAVVSDLMNVFGRREHSRINIGHGLRIVNLIARVMKCRKAEFIFDPYSEIT